MANLDRNTGVQNRSKEAGGYEQVVAARAGVVTRAVAHVEDTYRPYPDIRGEVPQVLYNPTDNTYEVQQVPYARAPIASEVSYEASSNSLQANIISAPAVQEAVDPAYLDAIRATE